MNKTALAVLPLALLALLALTACAPKSKTVKKPAAASRSVDKPKVEAHYIEGVYAYAEGDTAKAIAAWKKALALDPKHAPTLKAMAEAKAKLDAVKKLDK